MTENNHDLDTAATDLGSTAIEETGAAQLPRHGFFNRLYTGTGAFDVIGKRKLWFSISLAIVAVAIASILLRGFTFGIDFEGGTKVSFPRTGANGEADVSQVEETFSQTIGKDPQSVVIVGNGATSTVQIRSETLNNDQTNKLRDALFDEVPAQGHRR